MCTIERLIYLKLCDGLSRDAITREYIYPIAAQNYFYLYGAGFIIDETPIEMFGKYWIVPFAYNSDNHAEAINIAMQLFPELY